jgi:IPT/TIG domain
LLPGGTFPARRPVVTTMSARSGASSGGAHLIVHGQGFERVSHVDFGWTRAASFSVLSAWRIRVAVPKHAAGTVYVRVFTASGQSPPSRGAAFSFVNPTVVSTVSAHSGTAAGGNTITITGSNLPNVAKVLFGTVPAPKFTVVAGDRLRVVVPAHEPALTHVRIVTASGTSPGSAATQYRFVVAPQVRRLGPASVQHAGGSRVTVSGVGYRDVRSVLVDGVAATGVTVDSWGRLSFLAPAHAPGVAHVQVLTPYGTSAAGVADQLTYT